MHELLLCFSYNLESLMIGLTHRYLAASGAISWLSAVSDDFRFSLLIGIQSMIMWLDLF